MNLNPNQKPPQTSKLSVDIPLELHERLRKLLPHGCLRPVINVLLTDLVTAAEANRDIIGLILTRTISLAEISAERRVDVKSP